MAQINTCLKRTFIVFNIILAVLGAVIILLTSLAQVNASKQTGDQVDAHLFGFIFFYILGVGTLVLSSLGAIGAYKENRGLLIAFLVCVLIGTLLTFRFGVQFVAVRPLISDILKDQYNQMLPLNTASEEVKTWMKTQQSNLHCCGLFSYTDWEGDIPESCTCSPVEAAEEGLCENINYKQRFLTNRMSIYAQPCFPFITYFIMLGVDIVAGMALTLAALGVLAVILSSIMIHQMRQRNTTTIVMTVPTVFSSHPPKYQELHNPPAY